jgi:hypothetical protein
MVSRVVRLAFWGDCMFCLICRCVCPEEAGEQGNLFRCPRCGDYRATNYRSIVEGLDDEYPLGRFAASHAVRRMHSPGSRVPLITSYQLKNLWSSPLPNPQRQAELLILLLGNAGLPLGQWVSLPTFQYCAEIGTADDPTKAEWTNFTLVRDYLAKEGLIDFQGDAHSHGCRLTMAGFARYEHLKREVVESRTAFMAMAFGNTALADVVNSHFRPAVKETGFDLYRLDDRPQPGIIDTRLRVDIRTARFLICDLTDENRGAYWEAGFAEGLGRPVFYTCERTHFQKVRTHFDTEHLYTVQWSTDRPQEAAEELKAAIRNTFPADAIMPDRAEGRP